jgi:hypothetical protein
MLSWLAINDVLAGKFAVLCNCIASEFASVVWWPHGCSKSSVLGRPPIAAAVDATSSMRLKWLAAEQAF